MFTDIADILGSLFNFFKTLLDLLIDFVSTFNLSFFTDSFDFITNIIKQLYNSFQFLFDSMPGVFAYGFIALLGIIVLSFILKLFQLIRFW